MRIYTSITLLLFAFTWLHADEVSSLDEAIELATKLNKPVLIDFWSDN